MSAISIPPSMGLSLIETQSAILPPGYLAKFKTFHATPYFYLLQGLCLVGYGLKEIVLDHPGTKQQPLNQRIKTVFKEFKEQCSKGWSSIQYNIQHGLLFAACGLCEMGVALNRMGFLPLGPLAPLLTVGDFGFFLYACYLTVQHNVQRYQDIDASTATKRSAVLGIINGLCYLFWITSILFQAPSLAPLLFCSVGLLTGALKILSDFLGGSAP
ncbi:MAG: hypothetical protein H0X51_03960 [Parachlamydiaceae bacterium]|nr:hypothetical protein [Parachlamydiaceae bacterium]